MEKVLIIEDDKDIADLIAIHIADLGFEIDKAFDGNEGLLKALNNVYKIILLDIRLLDLTEWKSVRKFVKKRITLPF